MMTGIYFCGYCGVKNYTNVQCKCRKNKPEDGGKRTVDAELTAAKARIEYLEQLAADRLAQNTVDAERIADMQWVIAVVAPMLRRFGNGLVPTFAEKLQAKSWADHVAALLKDK